MSDRFSSVKYYLQHLLRARHRGGHGIHSPFVFDFAVNVLFTKDVLPDEQHIRNLHKELRNSREMIRVKEIGAGSRRFSQPERRVSQMARHSSVKMNFARLLYRITKHYQPAVTLELGTSIGLSAYCLALGNPSGKIITVEGNESLCDFARQLFRKKEVSSIEVLHSDFDACLTGLPEADLVYIDGNHDYAPTLRYFEHFAGKMHKGILLFDDIHWSINMHRAWKEIVADERSIVSIDLYQMGIVFLDKAITPGRYVIRF